MEKKTAEEIILFDMSARGYVFPIHEVPLHIASDCAVRYADQQTAPLEERVKELEGIILSVKQLLDAEYIGEAIDLLETKSNALNPKQQ